MKPLQSSDGKALQRSAQTNFETAEVVWTAGPGRDTAACQWYWTAAADVSSSSTTPDRFMFGSAPELLELCC